MYSQSDEIWTENMDRKYYKMDFQSNRQTPNETNRQVGLPTGLNFETETQSDKLTQTQMQTDTLYTLHILYYLDSYDDRTL